MIVQHFVQAIKIMAPDAIAGTATAGIPWAAWIAMELKLPLVYVRSSSKDHGRQNAIEGTLPKGARVVLIEDLISTGKSSLAAAQKLTEAGMSVLSIMSIFNYDFNQTKEIFQKAQLSYHSLTGFDSLTHVAFDQKLLDSHDLKLVLNWKKGIIFP